MEIDQVPKFIELVKGIMPYLKASQDPIFTLAVNTTPAQGLRNSADALERRDIAIYALRQFMQENMGC